MKLLSLKGRNIGLLKGDFEFEFDEALTVITGPIGCGKSTILTMVRASLTNSFPGNAASWASWGVSPQEACYFVASWRIGKKTLHIAKAVSGEKKFAALNIPRLRIEHEDGNVEDVFGSREALERTHALIPVPASIIDGHLIVDQDSITAPVSATPAKFKEIIHVLTRTNELEDMRSQIRDVLVAVTVPDVELPLQEAKADKNMAEGHRNALATEMQNLSAQYAVMDVNCINAELDYHEGLRTSDETRRQINSKLAVCRNSIRSLQQQLDNANTALLALIQERESTKESVEEARKALYSADVLIAANNKLNALRAKAAQLAKELQTCLESEPVVPEQPRPTEEHIAELRSRLDEEKEQHTLDARRLSLAEQGACPECGVSTTLCQHDKEELVRAVSEAVENIKSINSALNDSVRLDKAWDKYESSRKEYEGCVESTMSRAAEVAAEIDSLEATTQPMTEEIKRALTEVVRNFSTTESLIASNEKSVSSLTAHISSQTSLEESLVVELNQLPQVSYDANLHAQVKKRHDDSVEVYDSIRRLSGSLDEAEKTLQRAGQRLDAQQKRADSVAPTVRFRSILEKASTALMKDGLPRLLSLQYMKKLNERLKFYLEMINAEFSAFIDDNLEFMARKSDGLVHHAKRLSGGQKQQASVCYLLAVNDVFASTLGVLALDEPSGAMQEANSKDLAEAFNYLAKMGQVTGRQFIVITHSNSLAALGCKNISLEGYN